MPEIDISTEPPMHLVNTEFLEHEGFIHSGLPGTKEMKGVCPFHSILDPGFPVSL
jgi:hypothetical protein